MASPDQEDKTIGQESGVAPELDLAKAIDLHVGKKIRDRRQRLGLTQQDLSDALGISYQQIQKYESGYNRITAGRIYGLSKLLGVSTNFFFDDFENGEELKSVEAPPSELLQLTKACGQIADPSVRQSLSQFLRALINHQEQKK